MAILGRVLAPIFEIGMHVRLRYAGLRLWRKLKMHMELAIFNLML